jgi:hypothetical protein
LGENKALFDECRSKEYNVKFEFSDPQTPQCIGKVVRKFQTFFGRIRGNGGSSKEQWLLIVSEYFSIADIFVKL